MKINITKLASACCLGLMLVSCGAKKTNIHRRGAVPVKMEAETKASLLHSLSRDAMSWTAFKATLSAEIAVGNRSFSSRVNMQAANGQGIRLSVVPFPLIEAVRVWFTPQEITIVDLINGRYVQEDYTTLSDLLGFNVSYGQLEALFLAKVFAPGHGADLSSLAMLTYKAQADGGASLTGRLRALDYQFDLNPDRLLMLMSVLSNRSVRVFESRYTYSAETDHATKLPEESRYTLYGSMGAKERGTLSLQWRRVEWLDSSATLQLTPMLKSKYQRISMDQVLKMLGGDLQ